MVEYQSGVAEAEAGMSRERKDILPWRSGVMSTEHANNFTTNQITVADARDVLAQNGSNVLGLSATWACVNLLAGTIASLPVSVYRTDANGVRTVARDHPLYFVLHDSPNYDQTSVDFWEYMAAGIELQGNAYATIEKRLDGSVYSLTPIRPDAVTVRRLGAGALEYSWQVNGQRVARPGDTVLHIRGPLGDALSGVSTLTACRASFDGAMSADTAAATIFRNGVRTSGALSIDKPLTKEQRTEAERLLQEKFVGALNAGRPMLLDNGMTWQQLSINPEDAQMLDSRKFGGEEICRIFGVPPAMVGYGDKASNWGTGKEVDVLGFIKFSLRRRLKRIEQALQKQLLTARDRANGITIEFNLEGLLRGDSAGRASFYQSGLSNGWMTINEVRRLENMAPVPGGDEPRMQSQNVPITQAGQETI